MNNEIIALVFYVLMIAFGQSLHAKSEISGSVREAQLVYSLTLPSLPYEVVEKENKDGTVYISEVRI